MSVIWEPYLTGVELPTREEIVIYEEEIGKKLPNDYKETLLKYQGQITVVNGIRVGSKNKTVFGPLLFLGETKDADEAYYSIKNEIKFIKEEIEVEGLIPFASDTSSGIFCFDYRNTNSDPKVVFIDSEFDLEDLGGGLPVADSFTDLLNKLED